MAQFKYGDLSIICHQCGGKQVVEELVTDGRAIYLFNTDESYIKLHCPDCNIDMEMRLIANEKANAEIEDKVEEATIIEIDEKLPKESIEEETV